MQIYIVRHGETDLNVKGIMQGWLDEPLNDNGRLLAKITGRELKGRHFDVCISSPLIRAKETAEIIIKESGNEIPIFTDDRIKEIHFGIREGTNLTNEEATLFFNDPVSFPCFPEGESVLQVMCRTQEFFKELISRDDNKTYLISTHGCALRAMLNSLYDNTNDFWHGHVPYNCCVNILESSYGIAKIISDDKVYYDKNLIVDRYKQK